MNIRHVRPEERLAKELRATRAGVSEALRPTGTELFGAVDAIGEIDGRVDAAQAVADGAAADVLGVAQAAADAQRQSKDALIASPSLIEGTDLTDESVIDKYWSVTAGFGRYFTDSGFVVGIEVVDGNIVYIAESGFISANNAIILFPGDSVTVTVEASGSGDGEFTVRLAGLSEYASEVFPYSSGKATLTYTNDTGQISVPRVYIETETNGVDQYLVIQSVSAVDSTTVQAALGIANDAAAKAQQALDAANMSVVQTVLEYAVSDSETVPPVSGWSVDNPVAGEGEFVWLRTVVTYADDSTSVSSPVLMSRGGAGGGVKIDSLVPFFAVVPDTDPVVFPAVPTVLEPGTPWTETPAAWSAGSVLVVIERIVYDDGAFSYTEPRVNADWAVAGEALAVADAARFFAEGIYQVIPSETAPTVAPNGASLKQGDQWWVVGAEGSDVAGKFIGVQVWDGTKWVPRQLVADSVLVPGSVGAVLIKDGAVTAPALAADAIDGKVVRGVRVIGGEFEGGSYQLTSRINPIVSIDEPFDAESLAYLDAVPGPLSSAPGLDGSAVRVPGDIVIPESGPQQVTASLLIPMDEPDIDRSYDYVAKIRVKADFSDLPKNPQWSNDQPERRAQQSLWVRWKINWRDSSGASRVGNGRMGWPYNVSRNSEHVSVTPLADGWVELELPRAEDGTFIGGGQAQGIDSFQIDFYVSESFVGSVADDFKFYVDSVVVDRTTFDSRVLEIGRNKEGVPEFTLRRSGVNAATRLTPDGLAFSDLGDLNMPVNPILLAGSWNEVHIDSFGYRDNMGNQIGHPLRLRFEPDPFDRDGWSIEPMKQNASGQWEYSRVYIRSLTADSVNYDPNDNHRYITPAYVNERLTASHTEVRIGSDNTKFITPASLSAGDIPWKYASSIATLASGWSNWSDDYASGMRLMKKNGIVYFTGAWQKNSWAGLNRIITLPAAYRPAYDYWLPVRYTVSGNAQIHNLVVRPNGQIITAAASGGTSSSSNRITGGGSWVAAN